MADRRFVVLSGSRDRNKERERSTLSRFPSPFLLFSFPSRVEYRSIEKIDFDNNFVITECTLYSRFEAAV